MHRERVAEALYIGVIVAVAVSSQRSPNQLRQWIANNKIVQVKQWLAEVVLHRIPVLSEIVFAT